MAILRNLKGRLFEPHQGVGGVVIVLPRDDAFFHRLANLNDGSRTGDPTCMTDEGLDTRKLNRLPAPSTIAEYLAERSNFDLVSDWCCSGVGFNVLDCAGGDIRFEQ